MEIHYAVMELFWTVVAGRHQILVSFASTAKQRDAHIFFSFFIGHYRMYKQPIDGVVLDCCGWAIVLDCCGWATPNTGVVRVNSKAERCSHFFHSSSVTIGCISSQSRNISKFQHILHSRDVLHTAL
jgi:hypothetical protein